MKEGNEWTTNRWKLNDERETDERHCSEQVSNLLLHLISFYSVRANLENNNNNTALIITISLLTTIEYFPDEDSLNMTTDRNDREEAF